MIVKLIEEISALQREVITDTLGKHGYKASHVRTQSAEYLIAIGRGEIDLRIIGHLDGVSDVFRVDEEYKLVSRKWRVQRTQIDLGDGVIIGEGQQLAIMAGPCSIESETQVAKTLDHLVSNNIRIMRGGAFKPRTSPYSFRGMGIEGLKMFFSFAQQRGIKIISEVLNPAQIGEMYDYIDIFQVGARNSQNFTLLDELGKVDKPVLLKRGISGTIEELLQSAEYVFSAGNEKVLLCERGIRTFERAYRNTFDINAIPTLKEKSHLPVIADPSHGIGVRRHVPAIALAAVAAGADGLLLEIHETPEEAKSDGDQTLSFEEGEDLYRAIHKVYGLFNI